MLFEIHLDELWERARPTINCSGGRIQNRTNSVRDNAQESRTRDEIPGCGAVASGTARPVFHPAGSWAYCAKRAPLSSITICRRRKAFHP